MEGDFELNKHGWYAVQNVEENAFLNDKLETSDYGIWYSVKFTGDATTHLWQTKTPPVEGEKYWGWIEKTKSGKTTKFKWDKNNAPSSENAPAESYQKSPEDKEGIARAVALKAAVQLAAPNEELRTRTTVLAIADTFLEWLKNEKPSTEAPEQPESAQKPPGPDDTPNKPDKIIADDGEEPINLSQIPF